MDETSGDFEKPDAAVLAKSNKSPAQTVLICRSATRGTRRTGLA